MINQGAIAAAQTMGIHGYRKIEEPRPFGGVQTSRRRLISRCGGLPNRRLYSRLNCEASGFESACLPKLHRQTHSATYLPLSTWGPEPTGGVLEVRP
jgi:hypothetical protein